MDEIERIEIAFPFKVKMTDDTESDIIDVVDDICKKNCPKDHFMWPGGVGNKPTFIPQTRQEELTRGTEFDDTVFFVDVSYRPKYDEEKERDSRPKEQIRRLTAKIEHVTTKISKLRDRLLNMQQDKELLRLRLTYLLTDMTPTGEWIVKDKATDEVKRVSQVGKLSMEDVDTYDWKNVKRQV